MSDDRIRWTVSLRNRDEKLIEYFKPIENGDRSAECRKLMYLGLELLEMRENGEPTAETTSPEKVRFMPRPKVTEKEKLNKRLDALI